MVRGFSAVEVLLASAVLALIVSAVVGGTVFGEEGIALSGARNRATLLAEEGLEAVRSIRDSNYSNLADGTHGLAVSGGAWNFSGSSDVTDIFTRQITVADSTASADFKIVTSTVTWQQNPQRTGSVSAVTELTYWQKSAGPTPGSCSSYCVTLPSYTNGVCRQNPTQCTLNGETYESGGDVFCTGPGNSRCCCL